MTTESKKKKTDTEVSGQMQQRVMPEVYVVVADNDQGHRMPNRDDLFYDDGGPIVFETYVNKGTIEDAKAQIAKLNGKYGKCRIARIEFIEA
jgi:hypothetical protein